MNSQKYSIDFKKSVVQKLLNRGSRTVASIIKETGVPSPTIYQWKSDFGNVVSMKKSIKRPKDRSPEDKLKLIIEFAKLPDEKRGEFLRREGVHLEHINNWKTQLCTTLSPSKQTQAERSERAQDKRKINELEQDLRRKEKALAEASALLILKKKPN